MKNRLTRYNNGYIGNEDSTKSISDGIVNLNKRNTYYNENFSLSDTNGVPYTPPNEWVSLPSFSGLTQYFAGVFAVYNNDSNFVTIQINTSTGNYIVDWGDGTTGSFADNVIAYKQYTDQTYSGLTSTIFRGYKTVLIQAWPVSGTITEFKFHNSHNQSGLNSNYSFNWLNMRFVGSSCTNLQFDGRAKMLEQLDYVGSNSMTTQASRFSNLNVLRKIVNLDTSLATSFQNMFSGCRALQEIPNLDSKNVTNCAQMFQNCYRLVYVPWMDTSKVTTFVEAFENCVSLKTIPPFSTANCNNMNEMFRGCWSLEEIPLLDVNKVTDFSFIFLDCLRLKTVPQFNFSTTSDVNFRYMFLNCRSLKKLPNMNFSRGTNFDTFASGTSVENLPDTIDVSKAFSLASMFSGCNTLQKIPKLIMGNVYTTMQNFCNSCTSVKEIEPFDTSKVTNFVDAFYNIPTLERVGFTFYFPAGQTWATASALNRTFGACTQLKTIPISDVSGLSGSTWANAFQNVFQSCSNLNYVGFSGISENFSIQDCSLGPTALNDLYTRLAVVGASGSAAKTITVSGNWGTANDNPNIAIAKGWSVSG